MSKNQFGKVSTLSLDVDFKEEKTYLRDVSFTAPYKIMQPFPMEKGGIQVMLLSASAGIMEGDCQDFSFHIRSGARMEFFS